MGAGRMMNREGGCQGWRGGLDRELLARRMGNFYCWGAKVTAAASVKAIQDICLSDNREW